jgi:hypothetical protein
LGRGVPRGITSRPPSGPEPVRTFDERIESAGAELKRKHPELSIQIDRTVSDFKERHKTPGEFVDWFDTMDEFLRAALRPSPKPYRSGKRGPEKRF